MKAGPLQGEDKPVQVGGEGSQQSDIKRGLEKDVVTNISSATPRSAHPSIHPSIRPPIYVTVRPPLFILPFCWAQQLHWTWATSPTKRWLIVCLRREQQQRRGGFRGWTVKSRGDQPLHASLGKSDVKEDNRWSVYIHFWSGIPDLCIPVPVCTCPPVSQHASRPTTSLFPLVLVLLCLCSAAQLLSPRRRSDVWNLISRAVSEISEESIGID